MRLLPSLGSRTNITERAGEIQATGAVAARLIEKEVSEYFNVCKNADNIIDAWEALIIKFAAVPTESLKTGALHYFNVAPDLARSNFKDAAIAKIYGLCPPAEEPPEGLP